MLTLLGSVSRSVRSAICLLLLVAGAGRAQDPQDPARPRPQDDDEKSAGAMFSEKPLCDYSGPQRRLNQDTVRIADTMKSVAAVVKRRDKEHVGINGPDGKAILGKAYQTIVLPRELQAREAIRYNPDWTRFGYVATNQNGHYVLVTHDGKEEKESEPYEFMLDGMPVWSRREGRYAFGAIKKGRTYVVTNAGAPVEVDDLQVGTLTWSEDGETLAFSARTGGKWFVHCAGARLAAEQGVSERGLRFSADSKKIAYASRTPKGWLLMSAALDKPAKVAEPVVKAFYDAVTRGAPLWSEDSQHLVWAAQRGGRWFIVVDGKETAGPYDAIAEDTPVWSKKTGDLAYGAYERGAWRVFTQTLAGVRTEVAAGAELLAGTPRYSADGNVLLYGVRSPAGWRVYPCAAAAKPEDVPAHSAIKEGSLAITPDGSKVTYAARNAAGWHVYYNGAPISNAGLPFQYDDIGVVRVSRSEGSGTVAMAAQRRGAWIVIVNGEQRHKWYNEFLQDALQVSRDGRRVGYYAVQAPHGWALWLDGIPQSCRVPYTYRFNPITNMLEGVSRDRESMIFHTIQENRP